MVFVYCIIGDMAVYVPPEGIQYYVGAVGYDLGIAACYQNQVLFGKTDGELASHAVGAETIMPGTPYLVAIAELYFRSCR